MAIFHSFEEIFPLQLPPFLSINSNLWKPLITLSFKSFTSVFCLQQWLPITFTLKFNIYLPNSCLFHSHWISQNDSCTYLESTTCTVGNWLLTKTGRMSASYLWSAVTGCHRTLIVQHSHSSTNSLAVSFIVALLCSFSIFYYFSF